MCYSAINFYICSVNFLVLFLEGRSAGKVSQLLQIPLNLKAFLNYNAVF